MKGLLIKDFKLLKTQKTFLIVMAAVCVLLLGNGQDVFYVSGYVLAMLAMLVISTISYDQLDNGLNFIFTFPVSRKKYVLSKYIFGMMIMAASLIIILIVGMLAIKADMLASYSPQEYLLGVCGILMAVVLIMSVMIPIQMKFGTEKSRFAGLIFLGIFGLASYAVREAEKTMHIDIGAEAARIMQQASPIQTAICLIILTAALLGISCTISVCIMKRKQF